MIICHCFKVSDREIRLAIELGARDIQAVGDVCAAGLGCKGCHEAIEKIIVKRAPKVEMESRHKGR